MSREIAPGSVLESLLRSNDPAGLITSCGGSGVNENRADILDAWLVPM